MKTTPTDIDREAARLFACTDGMRAGWSYTSATSVPPKQRLAWERIRQDGRVPDALDTDDPATVGCMHAQVEAAHGGPVDVVWRWKTAGTIEYAAEWCEGDSFVDTAAGPTRGAALVAAMRQIQNGTTP